MRSYDKEFKLNAIKLYQESGRSMNSIADELGLPSTTFHQWITAYKKEGDDGFPGKGNLKSSEWLLVSSKQLWQRKHAGWTVDLL